MPTCVDVEHSLHMQARFHHPRARGFLQFAALAACLLLAACGGTVGGDASSSTNNPVIVSIGASPASLTFGESTTLTWSTSNATGCQASGAWTGTVALSGTQLVTPSAAGTHSYTLTCNGVANSAAVVVAAPAAPARVPTVSLSVAPASVPVGQPSTLTWSTTDASSCVATGDAWAGGRATSGSITVRQTLAGTYTYGLSCTGAGGSASGAVTLAATDLGSNVALVFIDNGPAGANNIINVPFVSATVCRPGTSICQTINHLLLDTASSGLRIIAPGVLDPALALPAVTGAGGNPVGACATFVSGYFWGSVRRADVKMAGETASSVQVQLVADSDAAFRSVPSDCSNTGLNIGTVARLGANGILGVGLFKEDCGPDCAAHPRQASYYECTASSGCTGVAMPLADQVANPVSAFAANNNGVVVTMPAVPAGGATTLTGALIFGIGTQSNNQVGSATVYAADSDGNFTTVYKGRSLPRSFLDTGSNGLFFQDASIPECFPSSGFSSGFYCPSATLSLSAVNTSANGASGPVTFTVESAQALDDAVRAASVGGGSFDSTAFDWGMPFFFGRTVFVAIDGAGTAHGTGPYWAY